MDGRQGAAGREGAARLSQPILTQPIIHGYAIVSDDDRIADASGLMPKALMNDADWRYFQDELDRADLVVVGRASHEATPNARNRKRLILSRSVTGLRMKADGVWWNPTDLPWDDVVEELGLRQARIAVPGGQVAFDLFLGLGFTAFHLSRAHGVCLPGGRPIFGQVLQGNTADAILLRAGLEPGPVQIIDPEASVSLTVFHREQEMAGT